VDTLLASPAWVAPGAVATVLWHEGAVDRDDGTRLYQVAGPVVDGPLATPWFVMCPVAQAGFADLLYRGQVGLADLRAFLGAARLARGRLDAGSEWLAAPQDGPFLPLLDAWDTADDRPLVPYEPEIGAFLPGERLVRVAAEAHAEAARSAERFATAWVCEECGQADDAAVFWWTRRRGARVRVRLLIENQAGLWTCHLHPFEFPREAE
jgi:hypothetical protein